MLVMIAGVLVVLWMVVGWLVITVLNLPSRPQPQPRLRKDSATRGTQGGAGGAEDSAIHRDTGRCSRESDRSSAKRNGVIFDNYSANLIKDFAAAQDSANLIKDFTAAQDNAKATEESVNDADDSTRDSATDDRDSATPVNTTEVTESAATFLRYRGDKCGTTASIDNATWPAAALPSKWQGDRGEWQGEVEQGRRQRLLKRRRRLISRLYDTSQDAEEILRLYFTSPSASRSASPHPDLPATLRRRSAPLPASPTPERGRGARVSLREEAGTAGQEVLYLASSDDSGISVGGRDLPASPLLPHCQVWCLALPRSCLSPALLNLPDSALPHCQPTIFGTVADETTPRDNTTKRGLPQTPKSGAKSCPYNGVDTPAQDWPPTPDDDNSLVYEDGVLVSGSLQALVQHAVPTAVYYPDTAYLFAFLLSSRLFVKPHDLLQRVCDVGFTQQGLQGNDLASINKEKLGGFVPHMVQLLGEWSETFPYDFRDERMMSGVRTMTHRCIALQPALRRDVTQVLHNLLNKLTQLERYEEAQAKLSVPPPSDFIPLPTDITEVCQSPLVMAQQLTHIELEKLSYIGPEEFVQAFAKDNLDACYKDLKKTSNLECYIQWFNRLSYLVATHACTHVKRKQRVRVIEWWIEVARECFNIGNFNSLMGIIAGLNMSIVSRLKKTWSKVQSAKFSVLEHQMDPSSNFSSYRSTLKAAMWRSAGAVDDRQKIVIPFFSLLVKDLYFLNEGCASRLRNGHINFDKFWQLAKQVTEFMAWKQVSCPFEKVTHVIIHMQTTNVLTETGLALASFECEGPDNSYEKERYKNLKADTQPPPERE